MNDYIDAIHLIANRPELNDPTVVHGQEVSKMAVVKVLMAAKLFQDELEKSVKSNIHKEV